MNNLLRQFWFRHYWWITALALLAAIAVVAASRLDNPWSSIATLSGVALGVIYFVQKQKLDEVRLFQELFTHFNQRYEQLNDRLQDIVLDERVTDPDARKTLIDYFNLCAEEYLLFSQGRILPSVWKAWCRGMQEYLSKARIRRLWEEEVQSGSYYGLTLEIIDRGAARSCLVNPTTKGGG
jgi:hypothetical protein